MNFSCRVAGLLVLAVSLSATINVLAVNTDPSEAAADVKELNERGLTSLELAELNRQAADFAQALLHEHSPNHEACLEYAKLLSSHLKKQCDLNNENSTSQVECTLTSALEEMDTLEDASIELAEKCLILVSSQHHNSGVTHGKTSVKDKNERGIGESSSHGHTCHSYEELYREALKTQARLNEFKIKAAEFSESVLKLNDHQKTNACQQYADLIAPFLHTDWIDRPDDSNCIFKDALNVLDVEGHGNDANIVLANHCLANYHVDQDSFGSDTQAAHEPNLDSHSDLPKDSVDDVLGPEDEASTSFEVLGHGETKPHLDSTNAQGNAENQDTRENKEHQLLDEDFVDLRDQVVSKLGSLSRVTRKAELIERLTKLNEILDAENEAQHKDHSPDETASKAANTDISNNATSDEAVDGGSDESDDKSIDLETALEVIERKPIDNKCLRKLMANKNHAILSSKLLNLLTIVNLNNITHPDCEPKIPVPVTQHHSRVPSTGSGRSVASGSNRSYKKASKRLSTPVSPPPIFTSVRDIVQNPILQPEIDSQVLPGSPDFDPERFNEMMMDKIQGMNQILSIPYQQQTSVPSRSPGRHHKTRHTNNIPSLPLIPITGSSGPYIPDISSVVTSPAPVRRFKESQLKRNRTPASERAPTLSRPASVTGNNVVVRRPSSFNASAKQQAPVNHSRFNAPTPREQRKELPSISALLNKTKPSASAKPETQAPPQTKPRFRLF